MQVTKIELVNIFIEPFTVFCSEKGVIAAAFGSRCDMVPGEYGFEVVDNLYSADEMVVDTRKQFVEYFHAERNYFSLPIDYSLVKTEYHKTALNRVIKIPYGTVQTYGRIAEELNSSARAVGRANAENPIPVLIPCHRVIGNDGSLRGYAGGVHIKEALLRLEGAYLI